MHGYNNDMYTTNTTIQIGTVSPADLLQTQNANYSYHQSQNQLRNRLEPIMLKNLAIPS